MPRPSKGKTVFLRADLPASEHKLVKQAVHFTEHRTLAAFARAATVEKARQVLAAQALRADS